MRHTTHWHGEMQTRSVQLTIADVESTLAVKRWVCVGIRHRHLHERGPVDYGPDLPVLLVPAKKGPAPRNPSQQVSLMKERKQAESSLGNRRNGRNMEQGEPGPEGARLIHKQTRDRRSPFRRLRRQCLQENNPQTEATVEKLRLSRA
jgi:hypothetical protein